METTDSPVFRRPDGRALPENHHLSLNPRGKFVLRLTVAPKGSKLNGRRIVQQLRTREPQLAMQKRDAVIEGFTLAEMVCRDVVLTCE